MGMALTWDLVRVVAAAAPRLLGAVLAVGIASGEEVSDAITSSQLMIPVGGAFTVYVYVNAAASSFASAFIGAADDGDTATFLGNVDSDFSATVRFPTSGPVFVFPPATP